MEVHIILSLGLLSLQGYNDQYKSLKRQQKRKKRLRDDCDDQTGLRKRQKIATISDSGQMTTLASVLDGNHFDSG